MNSSVALTARIDFQLGYFIRKTYCGWNLLSLDLRRYYVERFRALRDELATVTGKEARITAPWTDSELADCMLLADPSPLETAVSVTGRSLRKYGKLPETLNSRQVIKVQLEPVPHGKSIAELEAIHHARAQQLYPHERPRVGESAQESGWVWLAERKVRPR